MALYILGMLTICQSDMLQIFFPIVSLQKVYVEAYSKYDFFIFHISPVGELALYHFLIIMFSSYVLGVGDYPLFLKTWGWGEERNPRNHGYMSQKMPYFCLN